MPYTTHGYWYGPGEPTETSTRFVARCGGPGLCGQCAREAAAAPEPVTEPTTPATRETLTERVAQVLVQRRTNGLCPLQGPCAACDCFDPRHQQERDDADAVLAVLAQDPGDLTAQTREAIAEAWGQCGRNWLDKAAAAALSVRWEHAAYQAAEVERLLAENDELATELATERTGHQATIQRAEKAEAERDDARIRLGGARIYQDDLEKQKRRAEAERDRLASAVARVWALAEQARKEADRSFMRDLTGRGPTATVRVADVLAALDGTGMPAHSTAPTPPHPEPGIGDNDQRRRP